MLNEAGCMSFRYDSKHCRYCEIDKLEPRAAWRDLVAFVSKMTLIAAHMSHN